MKEKLRQQALRELCLGVDIFPKEILTWIEEENLWNIWVPKEYGGLELTLIQGLSKLKELAKIDGSLGWTITLCSGANYFIGNLEPEAAKQIFQTPKATVLGGSGGVYGNAEKIGDAYKISGTWRYATGASYLTHFTLNAEIRENGKTILNKEGAPLIRSFILPKEHVKIIKDWDTMGLKASDTQSFEVKNVLVPARFSFLYNKFYQTQDIYKIPFSVFADLTLWVNYIGMAEHFLAKVRYNQLAGTLRNLEENINLSNLEIKRFSGDILEKISAQKKISNDFMEQIHDTASRSVRTISHSIIAVYPYLGIKASRENQPLNKIFCDYFTATQHHIFTK